MGCKRITPSDTYWKVVKGFCSCDTTQVFNRDNVELVTDKIEALCKEGVVTKDNTYEVM